MATQTIEEMSAIDPRIGYLVTDAKSYNPPEPFCADWAYDEVFAPQVKRLVGWCSPFPALQESSCYELLVRTVSMAIPDCTADCGCRLEVRA